MDKEVDLFRSMLAHGMFALVNNEPDLTTAEGLRDAKEAFDVYVSVFDQLVNGENVDN